MNAELEAELAEARTAAKTDGKVEASNVESKAGIGTAFTTELPLSP